MTGVVLRCPNCGTTRSTPGECEACHEAQVVRYYCTNHDPGEWLDEPTCGDAGRIRRSAAAPSAGPVAVTPAALATPAAAAHARRFVRAAAEGGAPAGCRAALALGPATTIPGWVRQRERPQRSPHHLETAARLPAAVSRIKALLPPDLGESPDPRIVVGPSPGGCLRFLLTAVLLFFAGMFFLSFLIGDMAMRVLMP